jgi:hypothetical protein
MNPELPVPQVPLERQPDNSNQDEHLRSPENADGTSHEREQNMQQVDRQSAPPPPPITGPLPPPVPVLHPTTTPVADDSAGPVLASDDDLIEKEWVDKAKKIIADTQNDPYQREKEVTKLQVDYLRKRYGKELGTSN